MPNQRDWGQRVGALVAERRGVMSQTTLAQLISEKAGRKVSQALVSELERGNRWGQHLDLMGPIAEVLRISAADWQEAMGLPMPPEDGGQRTSTFAEIVAKDETLSKVARNHLLNQYELLQLATERERAGKPVLHEDHTDSAARPRGRKGA